MLVSSFQLCKNISLYLTILFPLQTRAAERREAEHGGQRNVPRVETQDITGWTNNSHASHDYRLLRHQKHKRLRLQEITSSVVSTLLASLPGSATVLSQSLTNRVILHYHFFKTFSTENGTNAATSQCSKRQLGRVCTHSESPRPLISLTASICCFRLDEEVFTFSSVVLQRKTCP